MKYLLVVISILAGCLIFQLPTYANSQKLNGVTISPAIEQINLNQGQNSATFSTQITNNTKQTIIVNISAKDFTSVNQNGGIGFINSSSGVLASSHGLASALHFGLSQLILTAGESLAIPVSISPQTNLAVGGHYAAVIYSIVNPSTSSGGNVLINQSLSSLIFLSTNGEGTQSVSLTTPVINSFLTSLPNNINLVFSNNGNTQSTPRGLVQIYDSHSNLISQAVINVNSGLILPSSKRLFNIDLASVDNKYSGSGIYHLKITYGYDGQKKFLTYQKTFLYINVKILISGILAAILIIIIFIMILHKIRLDKNKRSRTVIALKAKKILVSDNLNDYKIDNKVVIKKKNLKPTVKTKKIVINTD